MVEKNKKSTDEKPVETPAQTSAERAAELDEIFRQAARDGTLAE